MKSSSESIPNYWNLSSGINWGSSPFGNSGKNTGGKMAFDPASLAIAGLGAGIGALSGFGQQQAANKALEKQLQFQGDALKEGILFQRDSAKANIGLGMFGQIWGSTTGADLDFGRQLLAKRREFAEFMPKESGLAREGARWDLDFRSGPAFKNYTRQENLLNLQSNPTLIADRAAKTGMFGRIAQAPIESLMV
jgi:hypothetical protein